MTDPDPALHLAVLGGVRATRAGVPLDLGGRRQRTVLALLVTARGQVLAADRLVDLVWPENPPARPSGVLQAFISHLRRGLQPDQPARNRTGLIMSLSPGYALNPAEVTVDAWAFEDAVRSAAVGVDPVGTRDTLVEALARWRGEPYDEHPDAPWAIAERSRLSELRLAALELLWRSRLALGEAHTVAADAEALVHTHPAREEAWRLLALALYRTGRQGDALSALRRARTELVDTLGLDPGPALRQLESDVLAQSPALLADPWTGPTSTTATSPADVSNVEAPVERVTGVAAVAVPAARPRTVVGREPELDMLRTAATTARAGVTVALVQGRAGSGKSALCEALADEMRADGWLTAWGRCPEVDGAPALFPWSAILRAIPATQTADPLLEPLLSPGSTSGLDEPDAAGDPAVRLFRLHRAVGDRLAGLAVTAPLLVVLDDLHRADHASVALLVDILWDLRAAPVLVVATFRPEETNAVLTEALAGLAASHPTRVALGPLAAPAVADLLRSLAGRPLTEVELGAATRRSDGNPFHITELGRLLSGGGSVEEVPPGVRDVVRMRLTGLPDQVVSVLRLAAVMGRDIRTEILLDSCGLPEDDALDAIETALVAGFLDADGTDLRFSHVLVRQALYDGLSPLRRARLHRLVANTMADAGAPEAFALAHHYDLAGPEHRADTARWCAAAARQAEGSQAYAEAAALWRQAADAARDARQPATEQLPLLLRLIRVLAWLGNVAAVRTVRGEAVELARATGDENLIVDALTAWEIPTPWTQRLYLSVDADLVDLAERALTTPSGSRPEARCRLLCLLVSELDGEGDARTAGRAAEAVALAESVGDPRLLTLALNAQLRACYENDDLAERLVVAQRVTALGVTEDLPETLLLGHQATFAIFAGLGHLEAARGHLAELEAVTVRHSLGTGTMMALCARTLLPAIEGAYDDARHAVFDLVASTRAGGEHSGDSLAAMCLFCIDEAAGVAHNVDQVRTWYDTLPRLSPEFLVRALVSSGAVEEARQLWRPELPVRRDFFHLVVWAVRARNAIVLADRATMARCMAALAPYDDQLVGASSGVLVLEPVAETLARLATVLEGPAAARPHWERSLALAVTAGALHSAATARAALNSSADDRR